eukprot:c9018_g1_i1.p1 GENE.c9018_g1_i1~~c9018_g1_i1.p1  ORF type:complete len:586 (-),score=33.65 c9018_g1_i1:41-1765(-)
MFGSLLSVARCWDLVTDPSTFLENCPICLGSPNAPAFIYPCTHCFCHSCITRWLAISQTCPLCKGGASLLLFDVQPNVSYKQQLIGDAHPHKNQDQSAVADRTLVYRLSLRCRPLACATKTNPTVRYFTHLSDRIPRLRPWLLREVSAVLVVKGSHKSDPADQRSDVVTSLVDIVCAQLQTSSLRSPVFCEGLRESMQDCTNLFLHELEWYARSGLDMNRYDGLVRYPLPPCDLVTRSTTSPNTSQDDEIVVVDERFGRMGAGPVISISSGDESEPQPNERSSGLRHGKLGNSSDEPSRQPELEQRSPHRSAPQNERYSSRSRQHDRPRNSVTSGSRSERPTDRGRGRGRDREPEHFEFRRQGKQSNSNHQWASHKNYRNSTNNHLRTAPTNHRNKKRHFHSRDRSASHASFPLYSDQSHESQRTENWACKDQEDHTHQAAKRRRSNAFPAGPDPQFHQAAGINDLECEDIGSWEDDDNCSCDDCVTYQDDDLDSECSCDDCMLEKAVSSFHEAAFPVNYGLHMYCAPPPQMQLSSLSASTFVAPTHFVPTHFAPPRGHEFVPPVFHPNQQRHK